VKQRTAQGRLSRALKTMAQRCRLNRHQPLAEQHQPLVQKLRSHYAYYGITGNALSLPWFREGVVRIGRKWLSRRRQCGFLSWATFNRLLQRYPLPAVVVVHSVYRCTVAEANP
jgi:hypothetical protein